MAAPYKVPMDNEAKTRKADCEFNGAEYVRNGPAGPVLALLRYASDDRGVRGEISRSVKQFVSDCAEKGSISPKRFRCCHGKNQAPHHASRKTHHTTRRGRRNPNTRSCGRLPIQTSLNPLKNKGF